MLWVGGFWEGLSSVLLFFRLRKQNPPACFHISLLQQQGKGVKASSFTGSFINCNTHFNSIPIPGQGGFGKSEVLREQKPVCPTPFLVECRTLTVCQCFRDLQPRVLRALQPGVNSHKSVQR